MILPKLPETIQAIDEIDHWFADRLDSDRGVLDRAPACDPKNRQRQR